MKIFTVFAKFLDIFLLYYNRRRQADVVAGNCGNDYFEWSEKIHGQRKRAEAWSKHKNEFCEVSFSMRAAKSRRGADEILQVLLRGRSDGGPS